MPIIGQLLKGLIHAKDLVTPDISPVEEQQKVLEDLLSTAKDTAFGKYYGFDKVLASDDVKSAFAKAVPFFDYEKMKKEWWQRQLEANTLSKP